ncbi:magnesium transporter [Curtobacterium sp. S6]|uniref:magnesium transporter n=1 Tax=Curtobacterium sp. S6 TaxID=1479623 RepID=UPI0004AB9C49|nr:magnesium transporter [Curtobacterium sp. S6]
MPQAAERASIDSVIDLLKRQPETETELATLRSRVRELPIKEITYLIRTTTDSDSALVYRMLDKPVALVVFEDLSAADQARLTQNLRSNELSSLMESLDPDDRASLLDEMPAKVADRIMSGLSAEERRMTNIVLGYPAEAIGRYMSPEVLGLPQELTVEEALERIRENIDFPETVYLLPVVGSGRRLVGVVGLRRLLSTNPGEKLGDIARKAVSAHAMDDREAVARRFIDDKLVAMPIVDREDRLVGILTFDDAVEIIQEEDREDSARSGGSEPLAGSYLSTPILRIVRSRIVWLVVLALSAILTVQVLEFFEDRLDEVVVLALFIPLLTGTGGNTGNQAATTVTRALAVGEVRIRDLPKVVWREVRVGMTLGAVLGSLGFLVASVVYGWHIGLVMGLTLLAICTMAAVVGGLMPLIAKRVGADPAVFSNPFISTFCDATGLIIYFTIATSILGL